MTWDHPAHYRPANRFEPCDQSLEQFSPKIGLEIAMSCVKINGYDIMRYKDRLELWEKYGGKVRKNPTR